MTAPVFTVRRAALCAALCLAVATASLARAQDPYSSSTDFARYAERLRSSAVGQLQPPTSLPVNPYGANLPPGAPFNPAVPHHDHLGGRTRRHQQPGQQRLVLLGP